MSPEQGSFCVAGVDGCKAGWFIAVAASLNCRVGLAPPSLNRWAKNHLAILKRVMVAKTFTDVLSSTQDCRLVCVDIPIGLSSGAKPRECDVAARRLLGPRASSVFPAPVRACLCAGDYEMACKISVERSGKKLSKQSFALLKKIRQVDDLMSAARQQRVREIHPEVSFRALNGGKPMQHNKKTAAGQAQRRKLLEEIFADMDRALAPASAGASLPPCKRGQAPRRGYAMDDALDALAAAWTAAQVVMGKAKTLPEQPELDSKGLRMEILCPVK